MSKTLRLADDLALPLSAVTEKIAFLGRTGSGKTYAAMKLAEEMLRQQAQIVALDAVGKWYGLRVQGAGPGFEIPVFGGLNGDYPLEPTGGKLIADLIVDRAIAAVVDVSQFTHAEQTRFALDFATQFYQRKKSAPSAVHLFLEECQEFVPQNAMPGEQAMLAAFERLWKLGRNFGIGGSLISQRPQEINKKALNQTGTLVVFNMTGPQERKAIEQWVSSQGIDEDIAAVLPMLKPGQPHVWSPTYGFSATVRILAKQTADVSSTPEVGKGSKPRPLTPIDRDALAAEMAATIERAKADDPRELRKRIADKDKRISELERSVAKVPYNIRADSTPALTDADRELLTAWAARLRDLRSALVADVEAIAEQVRQKVAAAVNTATLDMLDVLNRADQQTDRAVTLKAVDRILDKLDRVTVTPKTQAERPGHARPLPEANPGRTTVAGRPATRPTQTSTGGVKGGAFRAMLVALAQAGRPLRDNQVAARAGMALSGTFDKYLGQMRANGWVDGTRQDLRITPSGLESLGAYDPLPTGRALQTYWLDYVGAGKKRDMLAVLLEAYPASLSDEQVANRAQMALSGTFDKYLGQLRALQLVEGTRQQLRASAELFA